MKRSFLRNQRRYENIYFYFYSNSRIDYYSPNNCIIRQPDRIIRTETFYSSKIFVSDASSSNEAVHLQQRLRSLSTELVTLRNRLHVNQPPNNSGPNSAASAPLSKSPEKGGVPSSPAPAVPPRTTLPISGTLPHTLGHPSGHTLTASAIVHPHVNHAVTANTLGHNSTAANNLISGQYAAVRQRAVHAPPRPPLRPRPPCHGFGRHVAAFLYGYGI